MKDKTGKKYHIVKRGMQFDKFQKAARKAAKEAAK